MPVPLSATDPFLQLRSGLVVLLEAYDWAELAKADPWRLAVEVYRLREAGLSDTHLRWLMLGDLVEHALELTLPGDEQRTFRVLKTLNFRKRSCFILVPKGADFARPICAAEAIEKSTIKLADTAAEGGPAIPRVRWDSQLRQLMVGDRLVKRFQRPAPVQEAILAAFEEEGWPPRIDDPLFRVVGRDPKRHLRGAIESLNQNHHAPLIHFFGDGTGEGVCWTFIPRAQ
jgi:hypothetical protein